MRVVLADDHAVVRNGLRWMLGPIDDIEVVGEAADGRALALLLETVETDVVLLDIRMPGLGGLDVLPEIIRDHPRIRVVILSMHDEPAYITTAIERGAAGYLLKSAGLDEVIAALRAVTKGRSYVQADLVPHVMDAVSGDAPPVLSDRERTILRLVADGASTRDIASDLGVSEATVKTDLSAVFDALGVSTRAEAVARALRSGLID
jgi:DNA-binding NarL/FixJ family response regulator